MTLGDHQITTGEPGDTCKAGDQPNTCPRCGEACYFARDDRLAGPRFRAWCGCGSFPIDVPLRGNPQVAVLAALYALWGATGDRLYERIAATPASLNDTFVSC